MSVGENSKEVELAQLRTKYVKTLEALKRIEVAKNQALESATALAERKLARDKEFCRVAIYSFTKGLEIDLTCERHFFVFTTKSKIKFEFGIGE